MCSAGPGEVGRSNAEERRRRSSSTASTSATRRTPPSAGPVVPHVGSGREVDEHVHPERVAVAAVLGEQLDQPRPPLRSAARWCRRRCGRRRCAPPAPATPRRSRPSTAGSIARAGARTRLARSGGTCCRARRAPAPTARAAPRPGRRSGGRGHRTWCRATCTRRGSIRCRRRARGVRPRAGRPRRPAWRRARSAAGAAQHAGGQLDRGRVGGEEPEQHERLVERIVLGVRAAERRVAIGVVDAEHVVVRREPDTAERLGCLGVVADGDRIVADLGRREDRAEPHHATTGSRRRTGRASSRGQAAAEASSGCNAARLRRRPRFARNAPPGCAGRWSPRGGRAKRPGSSGALARTRGAGTPPAGRGRADRAVRSAARHGWPSRTSPTPWSPSESSPRRARCRRW